MKVGKEVVAKMVLNDAKKPVIEWARLWSEWRDFQEHEDVLALKARCDTILTQAAGKGKGKKGKTH